MDHHEGGRFNLAELNPCRIPGRQSAQKPFGEWFVGVGFKRVGHGLRQVLIADDIPEGTAVFSFGFLRETDLIWSP